MYRIFCLFLAIFCWISNVNSQQIGFNLNDPKGYVEVPFELYNNLVVIDVFVDSALPLRFIVDTGVRTTIITDKDLTDLIQVDYNRKLEIQGAGTGGPITAYVANNVNLEINGLVGSGQAMLVLEEDYLRLKEYLGASIHGIIGYELFSNFVVEIDYDEKKMRIIEPAQYKPRRSFTRMDLELEGTKPYIYCGVAFGDDIGQKIRLMVDTGASQGLLLERDSELEVPEPEAKMETSLGRGLSGPISGYVARVDHLMLKEHCFEDVITSFPNPEDYKFYSDHERQGTLGGDVLSRFMVVFDYKNGSMYLRKGANYRKEFEFDMSGLVLKIDNRYPGSFMVDDVRKDSPAEKAGIKTGDLIFRINGSVRGSVTLSQVNALLRKKEGKTIKLKIKRGNQFIKKKFDLERQI